MGIVCNQMGQGGSIAGSDVDVEWVDGGLREEKSKSSGERKAPLRPKCCGGDGMIRRSEKWPPDMK